MKYQSLHREYILMSRIGGKLPSTVPECNWKMLAIYGEGYFVLNFLSIWITQRVDNNRNNYLTFSTKWWNVAIKWTNARQQLGLNRCEQLTLVIILCNEKRRKKINTNANNNMSHTLRPDYKVDTHTLFVVLYLLFGE